MSYLIIEDWDSREAKGISIILGIAIFSVIFYVLYLSLSPMLPLSENTINDLFVIYIAGGFLIAPLIIIFILAIFVNMIDTKVLLFIGAFIHAIRRHHNVDG